MPILGQPDTSIYGQTQLWNAPGLAPQGRGGGQAGPTAGQMKFQADQQTEAEINALAEQYGDDYDGFVKALATKHPDRAYAAGEAVEKWRKAGADTYKAQSEAASAGIDAGLKRLQGADVNDIGERVDAILAENPRLAPILTPLKTNFTPERLQQVEMIGMNNKNFWDWQARAADAIASGEKMKGIASAYAGATSPEQRQIVDKTLKSGGYGPLIGMYKTPDEAKAYLQTQQGLEPQKAGEDKAKDLVANTTGGLTGTAGLELAQYMKAHGITDPLDPRLAGVVNQIRKKEKQAITIGGSGVAASQSPAPSDSVRGYMDDITSGALKLTDVPAAGGMRNSVVAQFKKEGYDLSKPITAQAQARTDLAKLVLPQVNQVRELAKKIDQAGLMGTLGGRWRSLLAGESTADSIAGLTPQQQQLIGQFVTQADLLTSGTALTHFGARAGGAAVEGMRKQLEPRNKSIDTYLGNLDAVQSVLGGYAEGLPGATKHGGAPDAATLRQKYKY